jgi:hypothetical protein
MYWEFGRPVYVDAGLPFPTVAGSRDHELDAVTVPSPPSTIHEEDNY